MSQRPDQGSQRPEWCEERAPGLVTWQHSSGVVAELSKRRFPMQMSDPMDERYERYQRFVVRDGDLVLGSDTLREQSFQRALEQAREWLQVHVESEFDACDTRVRVRDLSQPRGVAGCD